jgi:hypothetical protein
LRCIPYLFFSTAITRYSDQSVQFICAGLFIKQTKMEEIEKTIAVNMEPEKMCVAK